MNRKQYNITQKAIAKFRKACVKDNLHQTNTSFAVVAEAGVFLNPSNACFATLAPLYARMGTGLADGFLENNPKENFALLVGLNLEYPHSQGRDKFEITDEESIRYLDWLCNRSPWSSAFVSKGAKHAYKQRTVILSTTVAGNLMGGAGVAVRRLWEYCKILRVWLELTARGVPETLAYYLASSCVGTYNGNVSWNGNEEGHHNLCVQVMGRACVKAFIEHKPVSVQPSYAESRNYAGYSTMWGNGGGKFNTWIDQNFPTKPINGAVVEEKVKEKVNPFAKAKAVVADPWGQVGTAPWNVAMDNMGLWWPAIYKELGIEHE